jgi:two-component system, OmpR family, sensor kinase
MSLSDPEQNTTKHEHSLARLLFFSHMALATTILISLAGVMFWMSYRATYEKVESELLGAAEVLDEQLKGGSSLQSITIPDAFFHRFGKADRDHAYWRLWDHDGNELKSQGKVPREIQPSKVDIPKSSKRPYITRRDGRNFELQMATSTSGQILVGRPLAKEFDGFFRLIGTLVGIVALGMFLAALIARQLIVSIARPIEGLSKAVSSIRHGELDRRLLVPQPTIEMTSLAVAMNAMLKDLQDAFDKQRKFTSDAAHELRTPVAIINGQCELSLSKPRDDAHYRAALSTCKQAATHMSGLVNQLLLLSRLDAEGRRELVPVNLETVVTKAVGMVSPLASQREVTIESSVFPLVVNGDESQLLQVMLNLLANAVQFSHRSGAVYVQLKQDGSQATIRVSDNGIGIDSKNIPFLCDRFFQIDKARTTTESSGAGLGLSIVSEIVKQLDGNLSIQSELGVGTSIQIRIPLL